MVAAVSDTLLTCLQDWLSKNIGDHPWLAHMHHHWCNQKFVFSKDSTVPQIAGPDQQDTTKDISTAASSQTPTAPKLLKPAPEPPVPAAPDLLTLTDDEILIYHDPDSSTDVQVHRGILQELQGKWTNQLALSVPQYTLLQQSMLSLAQIRRCLCKLQPAVHEGSEVQLLIADVIVRLLAVISFLCSVYMLFSCLSGAMSILLQTPLANLWMLAHSSVSWLYTITRSSSSTCLPTKSSMPLCAS